MFGMVKYLPSTLTNCLIVSYHYENQIFINHRNIHNTAHSPLMPRNKFNIHLYLHLSRKFMKTINFSSHLCTLNII